MLHDIIFRASTTDQTTTTQLLPYDFLRKYVPLSLDIEDTFDLRSHAPIDKVDITPRRVFYLEDINSYLILDVGDPIMVKLYLVDGITHEMKCSYTYMVESYANYKKDDQIVDMCVHHTGMRNQIEVTFLIINNTLRTANLATYKLEYAKLGIVPNDDEAGPVYQIRLLDLVHFADIIPAGKRDEIALGYQEANGGPQNRNYPSFLIEELVPTLKSRLFMGELIPKYTNITIDDKGRFIILLGTRITVWMGPFLPFPVDAQYLVMMDRSGMNIKFTLLSPQENAMSFDEKQEHQPYKYSLSVWDGRYLICLEDRKSRYLTPLLVFDGLAEKGTASSQWFSDRDWDGGAVADHYYPMRRNRISTVGYCTRWDNYSYIEPVHRETVWVMVDICDLLKDIKTQDEPPQSPPYQADIVLLIDDSFTMGDPIAQVRINLVKLLTNLTGVGVTDIMVGVAPYQNNRVAMTESTTGSTRKWASTLLSDTLGVSAMLLNVKASSFTSPTPTTNVGDRSQTELHRGLTSRYAPASMNPASLVDPWGAIDWACSTYEFRPNVKARFVMLVTDTFDEIQHPEKLGVGFQDRVPSSSSSYVTAMSSLTNVGASLYVVCPDQYESTYDPVITATNGGHLNMVGDWGALMATDLAQIILDRILQKDDAPKDWWSYITQKWGPAIYYHYTPALDFEANSLITIFHDDVTFMVNGAVVRNRINWLTCYDNYPVLGGEAQDSFYLPGLIPDEEVTQLFIIRNESYTGVMKKIKLELLDKPDDVEITINDWPEELEPRQNVPISITAKYVPAEDAEAPPERHLDIHYKMSYWMSHVLSCANPIKEAEEDANLILNPDELFFVETDEADKFIAADAKAIAFDPMYTLAFTTKTEYKEDDLAEQETWTDRLYIMTKAIVNSTAFERVEPVPITSIAGYDTATTGCCWLKVRGPVIWTTTRDYECRTNVKTWYLVNQSAKNTYVAHPVMDPASAPEHKGMGFFLWEYPEGNIIPPGESRPVTIRWQPIFNPDGEDMTRKTTRPKVRNCQDGSVGTIWSTEDGFFNNLLYGMAVGHKDDNDRYIQYPDYDTEFTHTYIETIHGDGMDIPVKPDQPLQKIDVKALKDMPYCYQTVTYFDVDLDQVEEGFQFLTRAGIWMGVKDDPEANDVSLPLGAKPSDMFDYIEWISPASGLEDVAQYIDHKFQVNPLYTFNADTAYPYQLAPFNKDYADPYVATMFMGKEIIKTKSIEKACYENFGQYIDPNAKIVPCDQLGVEQAGWLLQDFWPESGNREASIAKLATENDYIFTKTVYAKNKDTVDRQIVLDYDIAPISGVSVQGITITSNAVCPPGGVASLDISFRLHYTYNESKCVNLVKDVLYIPVFLE